MLSRDEFLSELFGDGSQLGGPLGDTPLQFRVRPRQSLLRPLPRSDVLQEGNEVIDGAVLATQAFHGYSGINHLSVFADPSFVQGIAVELPGHNTVEVSHICRQV